MSDKQHEPTEAEMNKPWYPRRPREGRPGPYYRDGDWWRATAWDNWGNPVTLVPWEDDE